MYLCWGLGAGADIGKLEILCGNDSTARPSPISEIHILFFNHIFRITIGFHILIFLKSNHRKIIGFLKMSSTTSFY